MHRTVNELLGAGMPTAGIKGTKPTTTTTTFYGPIDCVQDYPGDPVPER